MATFLLLLLFSPPANDLPTTGPVDPALAPFDRLMTSFLAEHDLPGAALAVAKDGRLVYARGFGLADPETKEPVQPDSLFRIASISKPITAVALLKLIDAGKLGLDDKVFDLLDLDPRRPPGSPLDPRWREVTLRQLLQHTAGWDRDASFDPMFRPLLFAREAGVEPPADPAAIIRGMLGRRLDFEPGEKYAYSNFGYCLLGRVIEKATGQPYEEAVRDLVLRPAGIDRMRLGHTRLDGRAPGEVRYVSDGGEATGESVFAADLGQEVPNPYGAWNLEAMDAHGGWLASAPDLARFGSMVEDLLAPESLAAMTAPPEGPPGHEEDGEPKAVYYGLGWQARRAGGPGRFNTWHTGSLPGTSTLLVRRHDGFCWAVLFNSRHAGPAGKIDPLLHKAAAEVESWPEIDLFPELLPTSAGGKGF